MTEPTATQAAQDLQDLRKSYDLGELLETQVAAEPMPQFQRWLDHALASGVQEPNAMTLATVGFDAENRPRPSSRIVLVKGVDPRGLCWFTNYHSRKGAEITAHPFASLQFHWVALERQVRFEGRVEQLTAAESDAYFHSRPLGSRLGAWASPQSQVVAGREALVAQEAAFRAEYGDAPPRPPHWGGYRLLPDVVEFWQGRPNRLHDRLKYRFEGGAWQMVRLAP